MANITDKTVKSKYPPKDTNVTWIDTSSKPYVSRSYINGSWEVVGGGVTDYNNIKNKPSINGVELSGNKTSSDLGVATSQQGAKADTAYQKPQTGIPESDLSSDVQQALQKHFKGWYNTLDELKAAHTATDGDSAYVKDASPATTWSIYVYDSTASSDNYWADSGTDADTSNVQTFASSQEVNEVHIVNDLTTGGVDNVLSAEMGKILVDVVPSVNLYDKTQTLVTGYINTSNGGLSGTSNNAYKCSPLIEIEPNTYYYLSGRSTAVRSIRCLKENGTSVTKILIASTGEAYSEYNLPGESGSPAVYNGQFKTPSDAKYVQFGIIFNNSSLPDSIMLYKIGTSYIANYPAPQYVPYGDSIHIKESLIPDSVLKEDDIVDNLTTEETDKPLSAKQGVVLDEKLNGKVNLQPSINLFDKTSDRVGGYIYTSGDLASTSSDSYKSTGLIPIKPNTTYAFSIIGDSASSCLFRFLASDGTTKMKPINPDNDEEISYSNTAPSQLFKSPSNAAYAQFTIVFSGNDHSASMQLIETNSLPTEYHPYKKYVSYNDLPDRIIEEANSSGSIVINIANSDKIGFFSNSFLQGYCMFNHHAINNMSMFSDYIMYNYGQSGKDVLELLAQINANLSFHGAIPVRNWGIKYGIIAMSENDGALYAADAETYYQNVKKMAEAIKSMGGIPILSTEHDWNRYYYAFDRLNREEGYMFMNWGKAALPFTTNMFRQFWYNYHPATRTAWLWSYGIGKYIDTLPRPSKSIKLFRVRNSADLSDLQNLMYDSFITRAERFIELSCGVSSLTAATEKNFDRNDLGLTSIEAVDDEYQAIQGKTSVSFGSCALIEIITPYDRNNLSKCNVEITGEGITKAYCKKVNGLSDPLPARRYYSFGITSGANLLNIGDSITISGITRADGTDLNTTYEIKGVVNDMLVTTTTSSPGQGWSHGATSGTDEPTCDVMDVTLHGSYDYPDDEYMERYKEPLGEWSEVDIEDGLLSLTSQDIRNFTDFDKIAILLTGTNIAISDIQCSVSGNVEKTYSSKELVESKNGDSLLTSTTFTASDTGWVGISGLDDYTPITSVDGTKTETLPSGFTNVKVMDEGDNIYQEFTTPVAENQFVPAKLQLKVIARYFPKYVKTDSDWATSDVTRSSFDMSKLKVSIMRTATDNNPTPICEIPIGAWWNEFVFDFSYSEGSYIKLECTSKNIHIAKCDLIKID